MILDQKCICAKTCAITYRKAGRHADVTFAGSESLSKDVNSLNFKYILYKSVMQGLLLVGGHILQRNNSSDFSKKQSQGHPLLVNLFQVTKPARWCRQTKGFPHQLPGMIRRSHIFDLTKLN